MPMRRSFGYAAMLLAGLTLSARPARAQYLSYDGTFFFHGLGDPFRWTTKGSPDQMATRIELGGRRPTPFASNALETVDNIAREYKNGPLAAYAGKDVLVGHSMGGVIARDLVLNTDPTVNAAGRVAGIVSVASPHYGAPVANYDASLDLGPASLTIVNFLNEIGTVRITGMAGLIDAVAGSLLRTFVENVLFNEIKAGVTKIISNGSAGAKDLRTSSPTIARLSGASDALPHANVYGIISKQDAVFYLWSGLKYGDGRSAVRNKNIVRGTARVCRAIFYNIIIKTRTGRVCHETDRALGQLDERWNYWTHGPNKGTSFDGFLPSDYTRYPGMATNSSTNIAVTGVNHFTITFYAAGLDGVAAAMRAIGMRPYGVTPGGSAGGTCGEASCTPVQGAYISHFTGTGCTGTESYYTPYFGSDGVRRSWNGTGVAGTTLRTVTNRSYKDASGACNNAWSDGNTVSGFVTIYR